jgi:hypothetical protein
MSSLSQFQSQKLTRRELCKIKAGITDCFEEAITELSALENYLGYQINDNHAMGLLNEFYADCWLLNGGWDYLESLD